LYDWDDNGWADLGFGDFASKVCIDAGSSSAVLMDGKVGFVPFCSEYRFGGLTERREAGSLSDVWLIVAPWENGFGGPDGPSGKD
jgi:hypothetical protein